MNNVNSASQQLPSPKTSGLAIASLVLGICGIFTCGLTAIIGLILGIVGLCAISKRAPQLKGKGLAIAGIIISAILIVLMPIMAIFMAILTPSFDTARSQAMNIMSMNNTKQICLAMAMYCEDNDGSFPPVDNWPDVLKPYIGNEQMLMSPFDPEAGRAWAMNKNLDGWKLNDIKQPAKTVLIFESRLNGPPAGDRELLPENPRTIRGYVIGFVDGHVESVSPDRLDEFIWKPDNQPLLDDR
ncbi:MAG: DUF4190 domain-containing protein [Phycisphaerae bacterium]|nr:DUF4190 domain-containing protein [Phycisphaerae bacterium]NIP54390.1 DUF4190 domain-containing protein [Phycisphaerae bacterium]NIS53249.1 DUF4190 domain-containing protein [Phycisphaerae bacterium]NIU10775.1 DUF4190 domain-containing protein [Phycisphaerae bacterium]NIU58570.1 DUF4190 domain-containing protein [Phycisphaerae bacterium]